MILEVFWNGLWTLSFGLSHFHGHGSWLVCEVALRRSMPMPMNPLALFCIGNNYALSPDHLVCKREPNKWAVYCYV